MEMCSAVPYTGLSIDFMMYEDKQIALMAMKAPQMMEREAVVKCIGVGWPPL